ncbi:MAG: YibE/F family protein [Oscillospiraceae bacterium]|nr:YibE/F family protein [Oscillospiraceae bacterium]
MKKKTLTKKIIPYFAVVIFAILFLYFGNMYVNQANTLDLYDSDFQSVRARVTNILDIHYEDESEWWHGTIILFDAEITDGIEVGSVVRVRQYLDIHFSYAVHGVNVGDSVLIQNFGDGWHFIELIRINMVVILGAIFVLLLLLFGRMKGLGAILSLGFTCTAIFAVFIPSIISGMNIYISAIIICIFSIVVTLFILNGVNKKSLAAVLGCMGGVIAAGVITLIMNNFLRLTGILDSESVHLLRIPTEHTVDLRALIFAGIVIGASGAIMDVAVSISSALWELKEQAPKLRFGKLYKSGVNIGRDIMGSMANTLVLAYIGSSLSVILLLIVYSENLTDLLNREMVIVELLQAIIGSLGILLAIPLTALTCATFFSKKQANFIEQK